MSALAHGRPGGVPGADWRLARTVRDRGLPAVAVPAQAGDAADSVCAQRSAGDSRTPARGVRQSASARLVSRLRIAPFARRSLVLSVLRNAGRGRLAKEEGPEANRRGLRISRRRAFATSEGADFRSLEDFGSLF